MLICESPCLASMMQELKYVMKNVKQRKCADKAGVLLEMFWHRGDLIWMHLLGYLNDVLYISCIPEIEFSQTPSSSFLKCISANIQLPFFDMCLTLYGKQMFINQI